MAAFFAMRRRQSIFYGIILFASTFRARPLLAQTAPISPDRSWHSAEEREIASEATGLGESRLGIEPDRTYSLAELITASMSLEDLSSDLALVLQLASQSLNVGGSLREAC